MITASLALSVAAAPNARLLVLDTLLPGQCLRCESPPAAFRELLAREASPLVAVGRNRLSLHSRPSLHPVLQQPSDTSLRADGSVPWAESARGACDGAPAEWRP